MQIHAYASDPISDESWQQLLQAVCLCIALLRGDVRVCGDVASSSQLQMLSKTAASERPACVAESLAHEKVIATTILPMQTSGTPLSSRERSSKTCDMSEAQHGVHLRVED